MTSVPFDFAPLLPAGAPVPLRESLVALSGYPPQWLGWYQYRALGAGPLCPSSPKGRSP